MKFIGTKLGEGKIISLGNIEKILIVIGLIKFKYRDKFYKKEFLLVLLYFLLYRIAITFSILSRVALYIQVFYVMGIDILVKKIKNELKIMIIIIIGIYSIINIQKLTAKTYKYIPYTSYLNYIMREKPSYIFRSKYNFIKWSERTGKSIEELRRN